MNTPFNWTPEIQSNYFNWLDTTGAEPCQESMQRFKEHIEAVKPLLSDETVDRIEATKDNNGFVWKWGINVPCSKLIGKRHWVETRLQKGDLLEIVNNGKGETFQIGDMVVYIDGVGERPIDRFEISGPKLMAWMGGVGISVENLRKPSSSVILTTEDGFDITNGEQKVYSVNTSCDVIDWAYAENAKRNTACYMKFFSTEEAAKAYIEEHKPKHSDAQIKAALDKSFSFGNPNFDINRKAFLTALNSKQ